MQGTSLFRIIIDNINDGVYFVDLSRRISLWNKAAETITGYTVDEVLGRQCQENFLNHIDEEGNSLCETGCPLLFAMESGEEYMQDMMLRHKDGHLVPVVVHTIPVFTDGKVVGAVEVFTPKGGEVPVLEPEAEPSADEVEMKDELTGLPSRQYLEIFLQYKFRQAARLGIRFCILLADIDNFGVFNNYYGQETGDVALQSIAASFKNNLQATDVIGRWSEDEFLGVFDVSSEEDPYNAAERVRILVSRSGVVYAGSYLSLTASVGATEAMPDDTPQTLVVRADDYMYQSKRRGKNCSTIDVLPPGVQQVDEFTPQ